MKQPFFSSPLIGIALLATVVIPGIIYIALDTSSMAAGSLLISAVYVLLFVSLSGPVRRTRNLRLCWFVIIAALVVVFIHGLMNFAMHPGFDFDRFWQSYGLLIVYMLGAFSLARLAQNVSKNWA